MNTRRVYVLAAVLVLVSVAPVVANAVSIPDAIVPCKGETECTVCHVVSLAKNIIDFFAYFSMIVAALLFVNAGALYVFSPANPGNISRAHRIFFTTLVGLILVLTSWLIIDTVMKALYEGSDGSSGWGPWNDILCDTSGPQGPATPGIQPSSGTPSPSPGLVPVTPPTTPPTTPTNPTQPTNPGTPPPPPIPGGP